MNTTDSIKFDVQAFQTPTEARAAAAELIAHASEMELREAALAGRRIFEITSFTNSQDDVGYVVQTMQRFEWREGKRVTTSELVPSGLTVRDRDDLFIGMKWDSNWDVRKGSKAYCEPAEFEFEVLARAELLSEFEGGLRYIEID